MTAILMRRTLTGLVAEDEAASAVLRRIPAGDVMMVEVRRPRNLSAHRRWWATANLLYQNCDQFKSPEVAHQWMKLMAGHATPIVSKATGEVFLVADSISFARLDEDGFRDVWTRACQAICEHLLPTITVPDLENEILRIVGGVIEQSA